MITECSEMSAIQSQKLLYFDLDKTLIATIFSALEPHHEMRFYKIGEREPRYSVLRPGVHEVFECITKKFNIGIITDAKTKRALSILKQFNLTRHVSVLVAHEPLLDFEKITCIPRKGKCMQYFNGLLLFDDAQEAKKWNPETCITVKGFQAQLLPCKALIARGCNDYWQNWDSDFVENEKRYFCNLVKTGVLSKLGIALCL